MTFLYILFGFLAGILGGMGMGGGTALIPLLTLFCEVDQKLAQGINLLSFIPLAVVALIIHKKNNLLEIKKSWFVMIPAFIGAVVLSYVANQMQSALLRKCFGVFLGALGIVLLIVEIVKIFKEKKSKTQQD